MREVSVCTQCGVKKISEQGIMNSPEIMKTHPPEVVTTLGQQPIQRIAQVVEPLEEACLKAGRL